MSKGKTMSEKTVSGKISVVIVKDTISYVAVGLEHYVAAQGDTPKDAMLNFVKTLYAELTFCFENDLGVFEGIEPAPQEYWDMYHAGAKDELDSESKQVSQDQLKVFQLPMIDCRLAA